MRANRYYSGGFWVLCVAVVAVAAAIVATALGRNQADPKAAYTLIFGIIAVFLVVFFAVRVRETARMERADVRTAARPVPVADGDPTKLPDAELWVALAIKPIDADALRARAEIWETVQRGLRLGIVICVLIFLSVPPIYLFHTFVPLIVGAPLIGGIALYKSSRLLADGAALDGLYDVSDRAMAPLGLRVTERYSVTLAPRTPNPGWQTMTTGAMELQGERYGRQVTIRTVATGGIRVPTSVRVTTAAAARFELTARDGKLVVVGDAPQAVKDAVAVLPASGRWDGLRAQVGRGAIEVDRKSAKGSESLLDLWLAERIAGAL
jgi:hypothetical protein